MPPSQFRCIYVGSLSEHPDRDSGWIEAFEHLGWNVVRFCSDIDMFKASPLKRACNRLHMGTSYRRMREELMSFCQSTRPDWVHFRLPLAFDRSFIQQISATGAVVTEYFNDDPFSPNRVHGLHGRFRRAIPAFDGHFVYREHNIVSFQKAGGRHVEHAPPALDRGPLEGSNQLKSPPLGADAAFIGHFEDDGRLEYMEALHNAGFQVAIYGSGWASAIASSPLAHLLPASPIFGSQYRELYAKSLCGLCFFSKLNRDSWTERPLEVIAAGGLLVCERTDEAISYFKDGEEALFFSSPEELVEICQTVKSNPAWREKIRLGGVARLNAGNFAIKNRAKQIAKFVDNCMLTNQNTRHLNES